MTDPKSRERPSLPRVETRKPQKRMFDRVGTRPVEDHPLVEILGTVSESGRVPATVTVSDSGTALNSSTVLEPGTVPMPLPVGESHTVPVEHGEPRLRTTLPVSRTVPRRGTVPLILVRAKAGHLELPNVIIDELFPKLGLPEQVVYLNLYRLHHGFKGKSGARIGFGKLAERCNLSRSRVQVAVDRLIGLGLIVKRDVEFGGEREGRGTEYEVLEPRTVEDLAGGTVPGRGTVRGPVPMKERKQESIKRSELSPEELALVESAETQRIAMERVPGHADNLRALFGDVMPWEPGYVPLAKR